LKSLVAEVAEVANQLLEFMQVVAEVVLLISKE
jgi:hypothetical protein